MKKPEQQPIITESVIIPNIPIPNYQPQQRSNNDNVAYEYIVLNGYSSDWNTKGNEGWELIIIDNGNYYFKREKRS